MCDSVNFVLRKCATFAVVTDVYMGLASSLG